MNWIRIDYMKPIPGERILVWARRIWEGTLGEWTFHLTEYNENRKCFYAEDAIDDGFHEYKLEVTHYMRLRKPITEHDKS